MKRITIAAAVALLVGGCAHKLPSQPQVNRTAKADKYAAPKKAAPVAMPTPNQTVQKRWMPKFKIKWLHPK
jgi:PBP1b-binding outer membrane lipoprotein LpoB